MRKNEKKFHFSNSIIVTEKNDFAASAGFGFFMLLASYAGLHQVLAAMFIIVAHTLMGAFFPSLRVNTIDLTPNYAGTLISITKGLGSIAGFVGSYSTGVLTPNVNVQKILNS